MRIKIIVIIFFIINCVSQTAPRVVSCGGFPLCSSAAFQTDANGWGWQNDRSCLVQNSRAQIEKCGNLNLNLGGNNGESDCGGYAICSSVSKQTDPRGWGWENNKSCLVRNSVAQIEKCGNLGGNNNNNNDNNNANSCGGYPFCDAQSQISSSDGWGWNGWQTCILRGSKIHWEKCGTIGGGTPPAATVGNCPSSFNDCPAGLRCGCELISGLGQRKQLVSRAGDASTALHFIASALMEGDLTGNYIDGDGKSGDAFNAGLAKQNWGMARSCHAEWNRLNANDFATMRRLNSDRSLDRIVYDECRKKYGLQTFFAGHRNGASGLQNPNTDDIRKFVESFWWTVKYLQQEGRMSDDTRFWVDIGAI